MNRVLILFENPVLWLREKVKLSVLCALILSMVPCYFNTLFKNKVIVCSVKLNFYFFFKKDLFLVLLIMYLHVSVSAHGAEETRDPSAPGRTPVLLAAELALWPLALFFFPLRFIFVLCV